MDESAQQRIIRMGIPIVVGLLVIGFMALRGCQEGPFGTKQVVALDAEQEAQLGEQAYKEVLSKADVVIAGPLVNAVEGIAKRLAEATRNPEFLKLTQQKPQKFNWEVRVVRSREVNAFCLPGGKVVVYTGILPVAETEDGLATVMGHEIGHALAHHGAERMAQQQLVQLGQVAIASSLGNLDPQQQREVMGLRGAGPQFVVRTRWQRR